MAFNCFMVFKGSSIVLLLLVFHYAICETAWAKFVIHSQTDVEIELVAYNGLDSNILFKGTIPAIGNQEISTFYHGLALLIFKKGQSYPVIIDDKPFTLNIHTPTDPPLFSGSSENDFFYNLLSGNPPGTEQYDFALLMIEAKKLLELSHSIHTIKELTVKKKEFHEFIRDHYESLKHSDMVRRLIAQYFMMHEYVDYHVEGAPATDIQRQYQEAVLNGVENWLEILKPHIPEHEVLNYCVSLYYNRSMVTLASLIIIHFRDVAYCPGDIDGSFSFPDDLHVTNADRSTEIQLGKIKSNKIIAFVSDDCPVSMVETITMVRQLADQKKDAVVIVAPLQTLSKKHLAMSRMISGGNMLFINDEKWRKENLVKKIRLPLFHQIEGIHE